MSAPLLWLPLRTLPGYQAALNAEGGEVGHVNYITDRWVACYMGQRTVHLNEADAKAWVEQQAQTGFAPQPSEPEPSSLWTIAFLIIATISIVVLFTGCAAAPKEPLPHYPCWDKKTQKYYECSDQEWLTQIILKERP